MSIPHSICRQPNMIQNETAGNSRLKSETAVFRGFQSPGVIQKGNGKGKNAKTGV